jgi:hypothetical protein
MLMVVCSDGDGGIVYYTIHYTLNYTMVWYGVVY